LSQGPVNGWDAAIGLTEGYLAAKDKADRLLELLPPDFIGRQRARCQSLFLGALRHGQRARYAYRPLMRRVPRPRLEAILLVTAFELQSEPAERQAKIVHHAVERSKALLGKPELGFLNAVLRQLPEALRAAADSPDPAVRHSHPDWLVAHWLEVFGPEATEQLLQWNQGIPPLYLKWPGAPAVLPDCLAATEWEGFYCIDPKADWQAALQAPLAEGEAYIKDPSTRLAPGLLAPRAGHRVLDLCAAPGGKAFDLARQMAGQGQIVAVDLPGPRIGRLRENLSRLTSTGLITAVMEKDLTELAAGDFEELGLPAAYDRVMLDAPCSNTGVIQRRTDVKWRLEPGDIGRCAKLQQQLIHSAARFVCPGGRFVYSTCSIEPEENEAIVDAFLSSKSGHPFRLVEREIALPWACRHDGASAFLLERA